MSGVDDFLATAVRARRGGMIGARGLYDLYVAWANAQGGHSMSAKAFSRALRDRGYYLFRGATSLVWIDIEPNESAGNAPPGKPISLIKLDDGRHAVEYRVRFDRGTVQWFDVDGRAVDAPACGQGIVRMTCPRSSVRANYAEQPARHGAEGGRFFARVVQAPGGGFIPRATMLAALRRLLVVVDSVFVGEVVRCEGFAFPYLAFPEFIQSLLYWPVIIVGELATAPIDAEAVSVPSRAVEIVNITGFDIPEKYRELVFALTAGDHHKFSVELVKHFNDPFWVLYQEHHNPGRVARFLDIVRSGDEEAPADMGAL